MSSVLIFLIIGSCTPASVLCSIFQVAPFREELEEERLVVLVREMNKGELQNSSVGS